MYVCPHCKGPLTRLFCDHCATLYSLDHGIPCFIPDIGSPTASNVRQVYDAIYRVHHDVWTDQGRGTQFLSFISDLVGSFSRGRILEIGCGEGALLATIKGTEKYGIDPAVTALIRARKRAPAEYSVARAEQLPFPPASFDIVLAIGVMEHFTEPSVAASEIRRVLAPSGHYITLIHTDMDLKTRMSVKFRQHIYPHFAPLALARWAAKKFRHRIVQPFRKSYTAMTATTCLQQAGLEVIQTITTKTHPTAPFAGPHVLLLIARPVGT